MCRNIKPLFNYEPPASDEEIRAAAVQYVRKVSGFHEPSQVNTDAFNHAIDSIALATRQLVDTLTTSSKPHNREEEVAKLRARTAARFSGK